MNFRADEVQVRSYLIWESEGCPDGRDQEFWFRAEAELAQQARPGKARAKKSAAASMKAQPAKRSSRKKAAP